MLLFTNLFYLKAYDFKVNGLCYIIKKNAEEVIVTSSDYGDYSGDIIIPSSVTYNGKSYPVTGINEDAFYGCDNLTSISIPESVTEIGHYAFSDCISLKKVTIHKYLKTLGQESFRDCDNLESVEWNAINCQISIKTLAEASPFKDCKKLKTFTFGEQVEIIPKNLCLGLEALTSITIPETITSVGRNAFGACSGLESVIWNAKACKTEYFYPPFSNGNDHIKTFTFGNNVEIIPYGICYNMRGLSIINIPESVKSIEGTAFSGCTGLTSITIPESVKDIYKSFENCTNLTSVIWNANQCINSGKSSPFENCTNISTFTFGDNVIDIPDFICENMTNLDTLVIPSSVTYIGESAFKNCSSLNSITIPSNVKDIGRTAFSYCSRLESVTSNALIPPNIFSDTFDDFGMYLYVPIGCKSEYQNAKYWRNFINIEEIDINSINNKTNKDIKIYTVSNTLHVKNSDKNYKIYKDTGELIYIGKEPIITIKDSGLYIVCIGDIIKKIIVM